jgi:hypothetical protein
VESSNDNESKKTAVLEDVISDHNTATLDLLQQIAIKSIEGYHMDSSTIVKLIVEDEIVKIQTLFWENATVKYSEAIVLEFSEDDLRKVDTKNSYNLYQLYGNRPDSYSFRIRTDIIIIDKGNNCYDYLGKVITDEIIAALSGQQDEYTGKYIFSRMESTETMETFVNDNNLQKYYKKTIADFENSYLSIKLGGNGRYIIGASEGLWNSFLFMDWEEVFLYTKKFEIGIGFYGRTGDSFQQALNMEHYFNENRELVVFVKIDNWAYYSEDGERIAETEKEKTNVYHFFYKK